MSSDNTLGRIATIKPRTGCLGCLWQVGLVLFLGVVLVTALTGLFYPWAFYLGGKFHIMRSGKDGEERMQRAVTT